MNNTKFLRSLLAMVLVLATLASFCVPAFAVETRATYTVRYLADDRTTVLQTISGVAQGGTATYTGATPTAKSPNSVGDFVGWYDLDVIKNQNMTDWKTTTAGTNITRDTTYVAAFEEVVVSNKTISHGSTVGDDNYLITLDALNIGTENSKKRINPVDVTLIVDRSASMAAPANHADTPNVWTNITTETQLNAALKNLETDKPDGYYVASNWLNTDWFFYEDYNWEGGYVSFGRMKYNSSLKRWETLVSRTRPDGINPQTGDWRSVVDNVYRNASGTGTSQTSVSVTGDDYSRVLSSRDINVNGMSAQAYWMPITEAFKVYRSRSSNKAFTIAKAPRAYVADALYEFVSFLNDNPPTNEKGEVIGTHRVSIISFGDTVFETNYDSDKESLNFNDGKNGRTEIGISFKSSGNLANDMDELYKAIYSPYVYGVTRTDLAMASAKSYVDAIKSNGRKSIAILFTDGAPTTSQAFEADVANAAINNAKTIKSNTTNGTTEMLSVGMIRGLGDETKPAGSDLDSETLTNANSFMHYVSSNYPNASSMTSGGAPVDEDKRTNYFSTDDGAKLNEKFKQILEKITVQPGPVISDAITLTDVVTDEFIVDTNNIKVYTQPYKGNGNYGTRTQVTSFSDTTISKPVVTLNADGTTTVEVVWNDAPSHYLRETPVDGYYGAKIYVEIPIKVDRDNIIGGNNVKTNTIKSGAEVPEDEIEIVYPVPNINIPIIYDVDYYDYFMDLLDNGNVPGLISMGNQSAQEQNDAIFGSMYGVSSALGSGNDSINGENNEYVNITLTSGDISGTGGSQTITADHGALDFTETNASATSDLTTDMNVSVDLTITPISGLTGEVGGVPDSLGQAVIPPKEITAEDLTYYAPKLVVLDFGKPVSLTTGMGKEAQKAASEGAIGHILTDKQNIAYYENGELKFDFANNHVNNRKSSDPAYGLLENVKQLSYTMTTKYAPQGVTPDATTGYGTKDRKFTIIPANNLYYDQEFLDLTSNGWAPIGRAVEVEQKYDNGLLHGQDTTEGFAAASNGSFSFGSSLVATVGETIVFDTYGRVKSKNSYKEETAEFTFTGTGFDLMSRTDVSSGAMIVEVRANNANGALQKRFIVQNYLASDTLNQLPVVRFRTQTHGTYHVTISALYDPIFDLSYVCENGCNNGYTNLGEFHLINCKYCGSSYAAYHTYDKGVCICGAKDPAAESAASVDAAVRTVTPIKVVEPELDMETKIRNLLGLSAEDELTMIGFESMENAAPAKREATRAVISPMERTVINEYNVYIDGIRVYNPLGTMTADEAPLNYFTTIKEAAYYGYTYEFEAAGGETNPDFFNVRERILDTNKWLDALSTGVRTINGIVYIADGSTSENTTYTEGFHLNMDGALKTQQVGDKFYILDHTGKRVTFTNSAGVTGDVYYVKSTREGRSFDYYIEASDESYPISDQEARNIALYFNPKNTVMGPKNEVYLTNGEVNGKRNGIAFKMEGFSSGNQVHLSVKNPSGNAANLEAWDGQEWTTILPIQTGIEMYYDITSYVFSDGAVILRGTGDGIISICNVKVLNGGNAQSKAITLTTPADLVYAAIRAIQFEIGTEMPREKLDIAVKSLNLQSYIGVDYTVKTGDLNDFDKVYVAVRVGDGEEQILEGKPMGASYTYFELKTYAAQMTEKLTATVYGEKDGVLYTGKTHEWSVRDGIMDLIASCDDDAKMTLLVDMLNYGAAAQDYFGVRTDALANSELTAEHLAYATTEIPALNGEVKTLSNGKDIVTVAKANLSLQSSIELHFMLKLNGCKAENLTAKVEVNGETVYAAVKAYGADYGVVVVDTLGCAQLRDEASVTICDKITGEPVSATIVCSAEALAKDMPASEMIYAMMRYSDSAKAYQN